MNPSQLPIILALGTTQTLALTSFALRGWSDL